MDDEHPRGNCLSKNVSQLLCEDKRQRFVLGSQKVFVSLEETFNVFVVCSYR